MFIIFCSAFFPVDIFCQEILPLPALPPPAADAPVKASQDDYLQRKPQIAAHKYFSKLAEEMSDAAAPALSTQESENIKKLVKDLGAEDFRTREKATEELIKSGSSAKVELIAASKSKDPEAAFRAKKVLATFKEVENAKVKPGFDRNIFLMHVSSYAQAGDPQLIPMLIALIAHPNGDIGKCSESALEMVTSQKMEYAPRTDQDMALKIKLWKQWWAENKTSFKLKPLNIRGPFPAPAAAPAAVPFPIFIRR